MELDREARWGLVWVVFWSVVCVVGSINLLVNGSTASALVLLGILVFIAVRWWVKLQQRVDLRAAGLDRIDMMSGIEFEQYVAAVLGGSGFAVTLTKTTGDFGVDLIAVKDGLRTAVQCKRQARSVGTAAIQQVVAGAVMYRCTSVMVVTNGLFTLAAQKLAKAHRVELVDRMRLERLAISGRRTQDAAGTTSTRTVADTNRTHDDGTFGALAPTQKCPPEQVPTERRETSALN